VIGGICIPKDNLTGAERKSLQAVKATVELMVLSADKGNATMEFSATNYN
jgi:hypothetical protein